MFLQIEPPALGNWIGQFLNWIYSGVGNIGWAIVLFTLIVRIIASPLDLWGKSKMRKQSDAMRRLQPQLDKLKKQYEDQPNVFRQEQYKLMQKEKVSMFGSCLPMIVNLGLFWLVLGGFRAFMAYQNEILIYNLAERYLLGHEITYADYQLHSFLWIQNVFMADTPWSSIVPSLATFSGSGMFGLGATMPQNAESIYMSYQTLVGPAREHFTGANGFLVLPILTVFTSFASSKLMQNQSPMMAADDKQKTQQRIMMFMMPLLMAVMSLFFSAAFALYMLISNIIMSIVGLAFNIIVNSKNKPKGELTEG